MPVRFLIFVFSAITCLAAQSNRLVITGRWSSEATIRKTLYKHTPIGCSSRVVGTFINDVLAHEGGEVPSSGNRSSWHLVPSGKKKQHAFEYENVPDLTPRFSEKWIGDELDVKILLYKYQGLPFRIWVLSRWRFARDGKLKEVIVEKQADGH